jgi:endonuclease IV
MSDSARISLPREQIVELSEQLADACHDHNIGRDISAHRTVSEVFSSFKAILSGNYSPEVHYLDNFDKIEEES